MQAVILAAGESSRFWPLNTAHKSLVRIMGKSLLEWTIESVRKAGIEDITIIENPNREIEKQLASENLSFVVQPEAKGMGNAILHAENLLKEHFLVLNPNFMDADYFINLMIEKQNQKNSNMVLLGKETDRPWVYGMLELEGDVAKNLIEKPEKGKEPSNIKVVGIYLLPLNFLDYYKKVSEHMYSYEDALRLFMQKNKVHVVKTDKDTPSLKYPWELLEATKIMLSEKLKGQEIADTAEIARNVVIEGNVHIGENTKVFENAVIKGSCYIGNNCVIGTNAVIRENVNIEDNCVIGANCEIARSIIQEGTHVHSQYVADSVIGKNSRIGAGFITANRRLDRGDIKTAVKGENVNSGLTSFGVIIGDNTNIGIGVKTMPGVMIGSNCVIGPGSVVFENIENNTRFYTKFENVIKKLEEKI